MLYAKKNPRATSTSVPIGPTLFTAAAPGVAEVDAAPDCDALADPEALVVRVWETLMVVLVKMGTVLLPAGAEGTGTTTVALVGTGEGTATVTEPLEGTGTTTEPLEGTGTTTEPLEVGSTTVVDATGVLAGAVGAWIWPSEIWLMGRPVEAVWATVAATNREM
jgi:hypothetical protein